MMRIVFGIIDLRSDQTWLSRRTIFTLCAAGVVAVATTAHAVI